MSAPARTRTPAPGTPDGRSTEHHVVVGLGFLSSLKSGDIDACVDMLHPGVEWHPSPKLVVSEVLRGRDEVRHQIEALYERFGDLEIVPEDGRQVGDHVLLVALFKGRNRFTGQDAQARQCWVITVREDLWSRIVVYPNPPAARLGFEEILQAAPTEPPPGDAGGTEAPTEPDDVAEAPDLQLVHVARPLTLTFTLDEAAALNSWLLKPLDDGALVADDAEAWPAFLKLRTAVEHAQALVEVRRELEHAGASTQHLGEEELARLARSVARAVTPLV